ncbi:hypothetical protein [uncultured Prevotella sp.]
MSWNASACSSCSVRCRFSVHTGSEDTSNARSIL